MLKTMSLRAEYVLPVVARGREAVEDAFARLVIVARSGPIPCAMLDSYRSVRGKQQAIEQRIVAAARAQGLHPPESAPVSLPTFGACTPGEDEAKLDGKAVASAEAYLKKIAKRARLTDLALRKLFERSSVFREHASVLLNQLGAFARVGTDESAPAPENIRLLRLLYYCGGTVWPIIDAKVKAEDKGLSPRSIASSDAEKLRALPIDVDPRVATSIVNEATQLGQVAEELGEARGVESAPSKKSYLPWIIAGTGTVATLGLSVLVWKLGRNEDEDRQLRVDEMMLPEMMNPTKRRRRRKKRRAAPEAPADDSGDEGEDEAVEEVPIQEEASP
jgi:hypothetical protein